MPQFKALGVVLVWKGGGQWRQGGLVFFQPQHDAWQLTGLPVAVTSAVVLQETIAQTTPSP